MSHDVKTANGNGQIYTNGNGKLTNGNSSPEKTTSTSRTPSPTFLSTET